MLKFVKALHLIGLAMFFGSILGHITMGLVPGVSEDPGTALVARQAIDVATSYLTLPGLALLLVTGAFMAVKGRLPILRRRWLMLHIVFGALILLNAAFVLAPLGQELLGLATEAAAGTGPLERIHRLEGREAAFGAANVLFCLAALMLAAIKPGLGRPER